MGGHGSLRELVEKQVRGLLPWQGAGLRMHALGQPLAERLPGWMGSRKTYVFWFGRGRQRLS